jgi:TetR/AcrR family transcriptional regulator, transcriptional repressor for nem operon
MSDKRNELEALAADLVQRSGLRELSFRQLADLAGIKSSSVHYYFPEKGDLTAVLISTYSAAFAEQLQFLTQNQSNLHDRLMAFVDLFEAAARDNKFCLCGMLAAELAALDERSRNLLEAFFQHSEDWLTEQLSQPPTTLSNPLAPRQLAAVFMSGLEGALLLDRVQTGGQHLHAQRQLIASCISPASRD